MSFDIKIKTITLGSEMLKLVGDDLLVITGPNNAGKSQFLKDIYSHIRGEKPTKVQIKDLSFERFFDAKEFRNTLLERFPRALGTDGIFSLFGLSVHEQGLGNYATANLYNFADLFCYFARTDNRLMEISPSPIFDRTKQNPETPIQRLFADDKLEKSISDRFRKAFGVGLVVHRTAGSVIPLYVGNAPDWTKENDRLSTDYAAKIECLPALADQGDGMKAFAGLLLRLVAFERSIIIIDEPEAFLHPPQARLIGQIIAEERRAGKQIFVATHSTDVVQGLIEARPTNLQMARITRSEGGTVFHWLDQSKSERFLNDTLLRTSNMLAGLFYKTVVLCEGDRDAVFYKEVLNVLAEQQKDKDALFINTNGKDRMPDFISALRDLGVNPKVIADVDLIRSENTLNKILLAKGAAFPEILNNCKNIVKEVNQRNEPLAARTIKTAIDNIFAVLPDENKALPKDGITKIGALLADLSPFTAVKKAGYRGLPAGDCQRRYNEVDAGLQAQGIWLVPEGEIEGFIRTGGKKGPEWIADALGRNIMEDPDLSEVRTFIKKVFDL